MKGHSGVSAQAKPQNFHARPSQVEVPGSESRTELSKRIWQSGNTMPCQHAGVRSAERNASLRWGNKGMNAQARSVGN